MQEKQLIEIFKIIKQENPSVVLTGSLALHLQKIELPRPPKDIDIYLPYGCSFKLLEGMLIEDAVFYFEEEQVSKEEGIIRRSYSYGGKDNSKYISLKVDLFQPDSNYQNSILNQKKVQVKGIECMDYTYILKWKFLHALDHTEKHYDDILYILMNNEKLRDRKSSLLDISALTTLERKNELQLKLQKPVIFFDIETTGIDKAKDRILEISMIKYHITGNQEVVNQRFNPTVLIPNSASEIHNIYDEDVRNSPTFVEKAKEISNFFKDCDVAGYNIIDFDIPILVEEFLRAKAEIPFTPMTKFLDALKIFYEYEKRDLSSAYIYYCDKILDNAHSAEADILATVEILSNQILKYKLSDSVDELHNLCNRGNEIIDYERKFIRNEIGEIVFAFGKHKGAKVTDQPDYLRWMLSADFTNHTKFIINQLLNNELI
jgi:DNA polymerase III subunit epsilon